MGGTWVGHMFKRKTAFLRGLAALKDKRFAIAKKEFLHATNEANSRDAHDKLGVLFFREGDYDSALHHFEAALSIDREFGDAMHHLSVLLFLLERRDEAVSLCQEACANLPGSALVRMNFGTMLYNNHAF